MYVLRYGEKEGLRRYTEYVQTLKNKKRLDKLTSIQNTKIWKEIVGENYVLTHNDKNTISQVIQKYKNINVIYVAESIKYQIPLTLERYESLIKIHIKRILNF